MDFAGSFIGLIVLLGVIFFLTKTVFIVQQQQKVLIERLGKYHATMEPGLNIIIPFIDQPRPMYWVRNGMVSFQAPIDMREVVLDVSEQKVITRDNVGITVDCIIYMQITDVKRAAYEIQHLPNAIGQLTQTTLRSLIGEMELDKTLSGRDEINARLKIVLDESTDNWGVRLNRVEIKNIIPPPDVQQAMEKQMQAERERRAQVLTAEGHKQKVILEAEGDKRSRIERSEGEKQERINQALWDKEATIARAEGQARGIEAVALAQAEAIRAVQEAFRDPGIAANYLIAMEYLKRFGEVTQKPTDKVFIPFEATAALGSLGGIREILGQLKKS